MALNASGPPASTKQIAYLASLLEKVGYASFREARHPFGLNQRQAGGKFTVQEASGLIDQLLKEIEILIPEYMQNPLDQKIANGSVAVEIDCKPNE